VKDRISTAFENSRQGFSVDRVVADPALNLVFLEECRRLGLDAAPATLNRALLNLRKAGGLRRIKSKRTSFDDASYSFASEMAVRHMERRDGVTLDDIISDPQLAAEFDRLAMALSPGFTPLEYRWAALGLRKLRLLSPELLARIAPPVKVLRFPVHELDLNLIPLDQGLYLFLTATECLYVGEAENLFNRLRKHLEHSDNRGLAHWLWEQGPAQLFVELQVLDAASPQKVRKALERELIRSRKPTFNVQR
jgi:site-specific DNA-methyltransferase (adenine-specific)